MSRKRRRAPGRRVHRTHDHGGQAVSVTWRQSANRAIWAAVEAGKAQGLEGSALEKYVRANGYPFGERAMHPYKIWCSEVNRVLGKSKKRQTEDLSGWFNELKADK
jgi:hypothetical protein